MRAWYDIEGFDREGHVNRSQLAESVAGVWALAARERERGIPAERIVLAGFSQGGAVALAAAACRGPREEIPPPVGAVAALSTYLPLGPDKIRPEDPKAPIFQAHGLADPVVPLHLADRTRDVLEAKGWNVDYRTWPIGHMVSEPEIRALGRFLRRVLPGGKR